MESIMESVKFNRKKLIDVAMKRVKADLVIKNAIVIDVFNHKTEKKDIAIADGFIAALGDYQGELEYDGAGMYACPGFVDAHVHIESSMSTPLQFAKAIVPRGTTTIIADPHELANVKGAEGIQYILDEGDKNPHLDIFVMAPSCVPATPFENSGAELKAKDLMPFKKHPKVLGLGELMNYPGTVHADGDIIDKLDAFSNMLVDGHAPLINGDELNAYSAAGVMTDHECTNTQEMLEKITSGFRILIREGSAARDCSTLIKGVTKDNLSRVMFCTDDRHPKDILADGHIDNNVRIAVREGIDPIDAIKIASLNACEAYRLHDKGALAPGYKADILLFKDLYNIQIETVFKNGQKVAEHGRALFGDTQECIPITMMNSVNLDKINLKDLELPLSGDQARVIELMPNTLLTNSVQCNVKRQNSLFVSQDDLLKIAVVERHHKTGNIGLGIIKGYGLKNGAIGTTVSHDSHNIILIGDSDEDLLLAVETLKDMQGGLVLVHNHIVIGKLPLPIAGLISDQAMESLNIDLENLTETAYRELRVNPQIDPFISLSFMALPVIPSLKITDKGLFDVINLDFISVG